jgi:DNA-binding NtrC family response regulator
MVDPRVLIVDDEETIRFALCEFFELSGCRVDACGQAEQAAKHLSRHSYDVAIVDLNLGGDSARLEGLDLLDIIKQRHPGTKAIVLSAYTTRRVVRRAYEQGAVSVLEKPTLLSDVVRIVFDVIGRQYPGA